jgi:hypothetical protein
LIFFYSISCFQWMFKFQNIFSIISWILYFSRSSNYKFSITINNFFLWAVQEMQLQLIDQIYVAENETFLTIKNSIFVKILIKWCDIFKLIFIEMLMMIMLLKFYISQMKYWNNFSFIYCNLLFRYSDLSSASIGLFVCFIYHCFLFVHDNLWF